MTAVRSGYSAARCRKTAGMLLSSGYATAVRLSARCAPVALSPPCSLAMVLPESSVERSQQCVGVGVQEEVGSGHLDQFRLGIAELPPVAHRLVVVAGIVPAVHRGDRG